MDVMTYTDARANLKKVMDRVIHDQEEVVVARLSSDIRNWPGGDTKNWPPLRLMQFRFRGRQRTS